MDEKEKLVDFLLKEINECRRKMDMEDDDSTNYYSFLMGRKDLAEQILSTYLTV